MNHLEKLLAKHTQKVAWAQRDLDGATLRAKSLAHTLITAIDGNDTDHAEATISLLAQQGEVISRRKHELDGIRKGRRILEDQVHLERAAAEAPRIKLAGAMMLDIPESGIATGAY